MGADVQADQRAEQPTDTADVLIIGGGIAGITVALDLLDGGKTLQDTITVEDPGAFTMSWSAVQRWQRTDRGPLEEISCAENNEGFYNYDVRAIPQADRPDF